MSKKITAVVKEKKLYLECLRIFCIILVIFIHTNERGIDLFTVRGDSIFYPIYLFCAIAPRGVAVPLFWMISGSLLIPKEETVGTLYKKRVSRIFVALILFSFIQELFVLDWYLGNIYTFNLKDFLLRIYNAGIVGYGGVGPWAYWYVYSYLGMLMILPLLRRMANGMNKKEWIYFFSLFMFFFGIVPAIEYALGGEVHNGFTGNMFSRHIVCFMTGHYVGNVISEKKLSLRRACVLLLIGFACVITTCLIVQHNINIAEDSDSGYAIMTSIMPSIYMICDFVPSFAVFYFVRTLFEKYEEKIGRTARHCLMAAGSASFGVMLIENILRWKLVFVYESIRPICRSLPACVIWVLLVWLLGMIIILIVKRVPIIKKLL